MANTYVDYIGDNTTTSFAFPFPYLDDTHIVVQLDTVALAGGKFVDQTVTTHYTIQTSPSAAIIFVTAPATGDRIRIKRDSASDTALVDFENGSVLTEVELDRAYLHNLYLNEEIEEGSGKNTMTKNAAGNYDGDKARIVDVADPVDPQDAVTKNYADTTFVDVAGDTMTGNLQMDGYKVTSSAVPSTGNDLTNKTYVDGEVTTERTARIAGDALKVAKAGDSMTGALAMGNNKITDLGTPTASTDAVTKAYADTLTLNGATEAYVNQQISNQITGSSTAPSKYNFTGNGSTTAFTFSPGISLSDDSMYEVAIDGVLQEPTSAYAINSTANTITFTSAPPSSSNIVVVQRGYSVPVSAGLTLSSIENIGNNTLLGNDSGSSAAPQALTAAEVRNVLNVENGATADQTASEILTSIKTVDGTGSGLDADLLDGQEATAFAAASHTHTASNITDFDTGVANNSAVTANTNKVSNATHTGDVTGATALTIADNAVTSAKIANNAVTAAEISSTDTTFNVDTNVGIGAVASGNFKLDVTGTGNNANFQADNAGGASSIFVRNTSATGSSAIVQLVSQTGGTNLARAVNIDLSSGNQWLQFSFSEGDQCAVRLDNSNVGNINAGTGALFPKTNGTQDLGKTATRWNNLWSAGTFNGSDRNLKQDIEELDEAEKRVAIACKSLVKKYRLKSAVEKKGDDARTHVGIIAQELQAAFEAEGLDAFKYSMIGKDTWWEKIEDGERVVKYEATEGYTEVIQMSVQYTELLAFIISAV
jgi:hypothetical protein